MADRRDRASELFGMGDKGEDSEESKREVSETASTETAENSSSTSEEPDNETPNPIDSTEDDQIATNEASSEPVILVGDDVDHRDHGEFPNVQDLHQMVADDDRNVTATPAAGTLVETPHQ